MRRTLVGVVIGIGFLVAIVLVTLQQMQVTCGVCMAYRGQQVCADAIAADRAMAVMQATTMACGQLSGGVTEGIRCNDTAPVSVQCSE